MLPDVFAALVRARHSVRDFRPDPIEADTLAAIARAARWFDEPITVGQYAGEKIDRTEFDAMLSRFYTVSSLDAEGHPVGELRSRLERVLATAPARPA